MDEPSRWLAIWMTAWQGHVRAGGPEGKAESDALLALIDEDGSWEDVAAGSSFTGHDELRVMFERSYAFCPDLRFVPHGTQTDGRHYAIEWTMTGVDPRFERPFSVRGISTGVITSEWKVLQHRDYWNQWDWMLQTGRAKASDISHQP